MIIVIFLTLSVTMALTSLVILSKKVLTKKTMYSLIPRKQELNTHQRTRQSNRLSEAATQIYFL